MIVRASLALAFVVTAAACDEPGGGRTVSDTITPDATDTITPDATDTITPDTNNDTGPDTSGSVPITNPSCIDGAYDEALPSDTASIQSLVSAYSAADYLAFVDQVLGVRYPLGQFLVSEGNRLGLSTFGNCIERFTSNRNSARSIMNQLSTVVHECGHILDLKTASFSGSYYQITRDTTFTCSRGDTTTRGGDTFARSRINDDEYSALLPSDSYRSIYLDGDPDDGTFDSGDQGFNSVLEETTQYVNSLATDWAFRDQLGGASISARDGILTFLWYVERYLRMARLDFPNAYSRLSGDACWRQAILTVWGRAWLYLELTDGIRSLGLNDTKLRALVTDPELLSEIDRLRDLEGCP
ncbi:MAG: hypothetical protein JNJ59_11010 [Deltaproteobacteria bacterium]|jgi:hypothetical protein|nr:hypothetical protein [Deltaproteobacteria bacterium]